jgi:uncharacterized protein YutD
MNSCHMSSKNKTRAKSSIRIGLGSIAALLATGILFMMLVLCSSAASQANPYPGIAFDEPYNQMFHDGVTLDSWQYVRMNMQLPMEGKADAQRYETTREEAEARAREAEPGLATMAEPALDPEGMLYYSAPYPNYVYGPTLKGAITGITVTNGGSGYSANPVVAIIDLYGTGMGATATATVVRGAITAISINPGASGSGYIAPIVAIIDSTGRGAIAAAEVDGIPAGSTRRFVEPQPGPGAAKMNSLPQYNPAAFPNTMAYPPGGKGYTSAPAIYITDITGRGANAAATVSGGSVARVTMISGGSGYSPNPVVTFLGGGAMTQAVGKATVVGGVITEIRLLGCDYYEIELGGYSERLIDPTMPDYGWDYVYYCHLFSNEELDMMYGVDFAAPPRAPSNLRARVGPYVILSWTDNSVGETGFFLQRATNSGFTAGLVNIAVGPNVVSYIDTSAAPGRTYYYRVQAFNVIGDRGYPDSAVGYPGEYAKSAFSNTVTAMTAMIATPRPRADGIGVFRLSNQMFFLDYNLDGFTDRDSAFGLAGDKPISGDWNADGRDGVGLFRESNQRFFLDNNLDGFTDRDFAFGLAGDKPISGDWNADGLDGVGVFRNSNQMFFLDNNLDGIADKIFAFGNAGDEPISGDWDGDGLDGVGVYRVSTQSFFLDNNLDGIADISIVFGNAGDKSISGDWDGDGKCGIGIFRDSTQMFHLDNNLDGIADKIVAFGLAGDKPIAGRWS